MKLNLGVRPCGEVKHLSENYCTSKCAISLILTDVMDVNLAKEIIAQGGD